MAPIDAEAEHEDDHGSNTVKAQTIDQLHSLQKKKSSAPNTPAKRTTERSFSNLESIR